MKKQILAITLALLPVTAHSENEEACNLAKSIIKVCLELKKGQITEKTAISVFEGQSLLVRTWAKGLCPKVYAMEDSDKFPAEFIANLFYENCIKP